MTTRSSPEDTQRDISVRFYFKSFYGVEKVKAPEPSPQGMMGYKVLAPAEMERTGTELKSPEVFSVTLFITDPGINFFLFFWVILGNAISESF